MKIVISTAQAKQQDSDFDGDLSAVMERAGYAVAPQAGQLGAGYGATVAVLVGAGNNGGDGYVAARHLSRRGARVKVFALAAPKTAECQLAAAAWSESGGATVPLGDPEACDLLIDAVFGVGFRGELPSHLAEWDGGQVLAVDVPSGLDANTGEAAAGTIAADRTVALSHLKLGHLLGNGSEVCGDVAVVSLGLPAAQPSVLLCEEEDAARPARSRDAHKWSAGSVAVVGGSAGMSGAAVLAAKAALGFGAGAVATFVPGALAGELDASHPEIMTNGVGDGDTWSSVDPTELADRVARFDAVVIGPGLGPDLSAVVGHLLTGLEQAVVLDADGLNNTTVTQLAARSSGTVVTPHGGEFERLTGEPPGWQGVAGRQLAAAGSVTADRLAEAVRRYAD